MWTVAVFGVTVLISLVLLCIGCREKKEEKPIENGVNINVNTLPPTSPPPVPNEEEKRAPDSVAVDLNGEQSISRNDSVSSRGSVRITITNLAETNGTIQDLDSPGAVSQSSDGTKSMADRELPQLPSPQEVEDNDHDYDILDDGRYGGLTTPSSVVRMVDYDTIENLQMEMMDSPSLPRGSDTPVYATVGTETSMGPSTSGAARRPSYEALPELAHRDSYDALPELAHRDSYDALPGESYVGEERRPSYEKVNQTKNKRPPFERSQTVGPILGRPSSEVYESPGKPIEKGRSGSERKAKDNEDSVSVIYASINPEFRLKKQESLNAEQQSEYNSTVENECEPPVPENPYAMLDNLLEDLHIPNPDHVISSTTPDHISPDPTPDNDLDDRIYEDLENMRPNSNGDVVEELLTPYSAARRTNPIIIKSSPYAISNTTTELSPAETKRVGEPNYEGLK